jgi:hypothetical protein
MKKPKSATKENQEEVEITLTAEQFKRLDEIISTIAELSTLCENVDNQPSSILELMTRNALEFSEELHMQRIRENCQHPGRE